MCILKNKVFPQVWINSIHLYQEGLLVDVSMKYSPDCSK